MLRKLLTIKQLIGPVFYEVRVGNKVWNRQKKPTDSHLTQNKAMSSYHQLPPDLILDTFKIPVESRQLVSTDTSLLSRC